MSRLILGARAETGALFEVQLVSQMLVRALETILALTEISISMDCLQQCFCSRSGHRTQLQPFLVLQLKLFGKLTDWECSLIGYISSLYEVLICRSERPSHTKYSSVLFIMTLSTLYSPYDTAGIPYVAVQCEMVTR